MPPRPWAFREKWHDEKIPDLADPSDLLAFLRGISLNHSAPSAVGKIQDSRFKIQDSRFKIQEEEEEEEEEVSCKMQATAGETPALPYEEVASSSHLKLNA